MKTRIARVALLACAGIAIAGLIAPFSSGCTTGGGGGGGTALSIQLALSTAQIIVGGQTTATATVTRGGSAAAAETVAWSATPAASVTLSGTSSLTDAGGRAQVIVTGAALGNVGIKATVGSVNQTVTLTIQKTEYVMFLENDTSTGQLVRDTPGATDVQPASIGGGATFPDAREPLGSQRDGSLLLVTDGTHDQGWIRNLQPPGSDVPGFTPATFVPSAGWSIAAIAPSGSPIVWIRQGAAGGGIVVSEPTGATRNILFEPTTADMSATLLALSPDALHVAFLSAVGNLYTIPIGGGDPVQITLEPARAPRAFQWIDNDTLAVSVEDTDDSTVEANAGIVRVSRVAGTARVVLITDLGTTPEGIGVDRAGNIVFDCQNPSRADHDIYRLDAPGYGTRVTILDRPEDDIVQAVVAW